MQILFVTLSSTDANTSATIRNNALIKGLIQNGNKVDILTIPTQVTSSFYDKTLSWDESINILKLKGNSTYNLLAKSKENFIGKIKKKIFNLLRKTYHLLSLFDNTIFVAKQANKSILPKDYYDLVISSSDPKSSHYAVHKLIKSGIKYGKWIQYWGDPLTIDITNKSIYPKVYLKYKEKQLFSYADRIVYVSPFTLQEQIKFFPKFKDKMNFIPIPYMQQKVYPLDNSGNLILGYFGDYNSRIRNIEVLFEVCAKDKIPFVIAGNSDLELKPMSHIKIFPRVSQEKVDELETESNVLVCVLNKFGTQIPGKVYHYAATNKPILVILDGEEKESIREYLAKFNRYILCDNNEKDIRNALAKIRNDSMEYQPSPFFKPKIIAAQFLELVK